MPERKVWSEEEDRVLRYLREERGERKWAGIARVMEGEFGMGGRTGKQCRERYHNHLDASIVTAEWEPPEQARLLQLHEQIGNKWSIIARQLPGRSDNCVKNHFYSRLRKSLRKINKLAAESLSQPRPPLRQSVLSKIIETTEAKFKAHSRCEEWLSEFANDIKKRLFGLEVEGGEEGGEGGEGVGVAVRLMEDIERFERESRKGGRIARKEVECEYKTYLKPPRNRSSMKRQGSSLSEGSEDPSSFLSISPSCSELSSGDPNVPRKLPSDSTISRSLPTSSANNLDDLKSEPLQHSQLIDPNHPPPLSPKSPCLSHPHHPHPHHSHSKSESQCNCQCEGMQAQAFQREHGELVEMESEQSLAFGINYNNMIYDDTPVMARILCPAQMRMDAESEPENQLFPRRQHHEQDSH